jgi:hypothetical protein
MMEETGIQPSLTEDDVKQYLEQVIQEVKKRRTVDTKNNRKGNKS